MSAQLLADPLARRIGLAAAARAEGALATGAGAAHLAEDDALLVVVYADVAVHVAGRHAVLRPGDRRRSEHDAEEDARRHCGGAARARPHARFTELELRPHAHDAAENEDDAPEPDPAHERV